MSTPFYAGQIMTAQAMNAALPHTSVVVGTQTISSTSPTWVVGLSAQLTAGVTYVGRAKITVDANSGGTAEFRWTGPASPTILEMDIMSQQCDTADAYQNGDVESATGYNSGFLSTPTLANTQYVVWLEITILAPADGTLELQCANAAGASDTFNIGIGSYLTVLPVQ